MTLLFNWFYYSYMKAVPLTENQNFVRHLATRYHEKWQVKHDAITIFYNGHDINFDRLTQYQLWIFFVTASDLAFWPLMQFNIFTYKYHHYNAVSVKARDYTNWGCPSIFLMNVTVISQNVGYLHNRQVALSYTDNKPCHLQSMQMQRLF